jgi:hypothetical protein
VGSLLYGESGIQVDFDDRSLAHVQIVVGIKLGRGESFFFSWKDGLDAGSGRSSIWLDTSIPLYFRYAGSRPVNINSEWIRALILSADSATGMDYVPEPGTAQAARLPRSRV